MGSFLCQGFLQFGSQFNRLFVFQKSDKIVTEGWTTNHNHWQIIFNRLYTQLISNKLFFFFTLIISWEHLSRSPITTVTILHLGAFVLTVPSAICLATLNFISLSSFHLYSFPGPSPIFYLRLNYPRKKLYITWTNEYGHLWAHSILFR